MRICHLSAGHSRGPNVALHKNAQQHPGTYQGQVADRAVDGNITYNNGQSCSHTTQGQGSDYPWWSVDLGTFYYLTGIRIYNSDADHRERLKSFSIRGHSMDGNYNILYESKNDEYMNDTIQVSLDGTIAVDSITIYLPPDKYDSYLTLCEVQVFAKQCPYPYMLQDGNFTQNNHEVNPPTQLFPFATVLKVICNKGFIVNASSNVIRCGTNGKWGARVVICKRQTCQIPMLQYGYYHIKNRADFRNRETVIQFGTIVRPVCVSNSYQLQISGDVKRECVANGILNGNEPLCVPLCDVPYIDMSSKQVNVIQQGEHITVRCNPGYDSKDGHVSLICHNYHYFYGQPSVCNVNTCSSDSLHLDAKNTTLTRYIHMIVFNETLQLERKKGYEPVSGDRVLRCNENQQFEGNPLNCKAKTCSIYNLHLDATNTITARDIQTIVFNETLPLECKEGYAPVSGDRILRCNEHQQFEGNPLNCKATQSCSVDRQRLDADNVTVAHDINMIPFNKTLQLECKKGYKKVNGEHGLRCNETKQLEGDPLTCEAIACSVDQLNLGIKNVTIVYYTKTISYNDTLQLECTKGYKVTNGLRDLRCNENEQFEGDPLQCEAVQESSSVNSKIAVGLIGGIVGGCVGVLLIIAILLVLFYRRRKQRLTETGRGNGHTLELSKTNSSFTNYENKPRDEYSNAYETANAKSEDHIYNTLKEDNIYNDIQDEQEEYSHDYYNCTVEKTTKICNANKPSGRDSASR